MDNIIAVPSENPGGLESSMGGHFGSCDLYTLVWVDNGVAVKTEVIANVPHEHGGCMAPVKLLVEKGVNRLIAGGMGSRPLAGFDQEGIDVFFADGARTVGEAVQGMLSGRLKRFQRSIACKGCGTH